MTLVDLAVGAATAELRIEPRHLNSLGLVHGGAIFTLAAFAFHAACMAAGQTAVGIAMNLACFEPVRSGTLRAEAREIARSRRLATHAVAVCDDARRLVAQFQATAYLKGPLP